MLRSDPSGERLRAQPSNATGAARADEYSDMAAA